MHVLSRFKNGPSHNRKNETSHRKNGTSRIVDFYLWEVKGERELPNSRRCCDRYETPGDALGASPSLLDASVC